MAQMQHATLGSPPRSATVAASAEERQPLGNRPPPPHAEPAPPPPGNIPSHGLPSLRNRAARARDPREAQMSDDKSECFPPPRDALRIERPCHPRPRPTERREPPRRSIQIGSGLSNVFVRKKDSAGKTWALRGVAGPLADREILGTPTPSTITPQTESPHTQTHRSTDSFAKRSPYHLPQAEAGSCRRSP